MKLKNLKITVKSAVAPTIIITLIFFLTYFIFGAENSMIGPFATLSFLRYKTMPNHYECMVKNFAIFISMAILSYFAVINLPLCIIINAIALFWIADILIDEYNPTNYFPAGMALIFFQIAPVHTLPALLNRIAALGATFVVVFLFVYILSQLNRETDPLPGLLKQGFQICKEQLDLCQKISSGGFSLLSGETGKQKQTSGNSPDKDSRIPDTLDNLHHRLCDINRACSKEIYYYNRASLFPKGKTNWYCHFILVFQIINYLTLDPDSTENLKKAENVYHDFHWEFENVTPTSDYHRLKFRIRRPDIRSFRLRFALRQIITVTPCLVFAWCSDLPNIYWLVISVFFMMIPFTDHTMQRVRQRVFGTIAGILICLGLFYIFTGFPARVVIMTIANFLIYGTSAYGPTVAYITCSALATQTIDTVVSLVLMERLLYTLIGAVIALLANRFIFPIRIKRQVDYLVELIENIRTGLAEVDQKTIPGDSQRKREIDQYIIKSYLLTQRLKGLLETLPEKDRPYDYAAIRKEHMTFMAEYLSVYLTEEHS